MVMLVPSRLFQLFAPRKLGEGVGMEDQPLTAGIVMSDEERHLAGKLACQGASHPSAKSSPHIVVVR